STTAPVRADRNRRAALTLIAGIAVLALAVAGLTYALLNRGGDRDKAGGEGTTSQTSGGTSPRETEDENASGGGRSPTPSPSGSDTPSAAPQSVKVSLAGSNLEYSGSCPPPSGQAPSFTATFTVGRLPAQVSYRWVSKDGEVMDQGWKTLSFPEGGGRTKQDRAFVTTYDESGTFENEISVEVRDPVETKSNSVPFSVTCVTETPTGGVSPSPTVSPSS
ncbi:serine/threonine protein kinase, partial [Streptomyces sp. T21Q-yed]|nr:serine/threonine protein kinase [Streptomyces sp. T21Q-yed]